MYNTQSDCDVNYGLWVLTFVTTDEPREVLLAEGCACGGG